MTAPCPPWCDRDDRSDDRADLPPGDRIVTHACRCRVRTDDLSLTRVSALCNPPESLTIRSR